MHQTAPLTLASSPRHGAARLTLGVLAVLAATLLALAAPGVTSAHSSIPFHAKLAHADPGIGAVLKSAPTTITLTFGEDLKPDGSGIVVYDDKGNSVSTGKASVSAGDAKTMSVSMQGDDSETYVVYFHSISADDGDAYTDAYQFTVSKDATASAGQQPDSSGDSISSVPHGSGSSGSAGVSQLLASLIGLIALIVGLAGGYFFARNQRRA